MSAAHIAATSAAILNSLLGLFVLARAPHGKVQQAFTCFALSVSVWAGGISFLAVTPESRHFAAMHAAIIIFIGSNLIGAAMVQMAAVFPGAGKLRTGSPINIFVGFGVGLALLAPTGCYVKNVHLIKGVWTPVNGVLFPVSSLYFCVAAVYFIASIAGRWRHSRGLERLQVQYLLLGTTLSLVIGIWTNLLMPLAFNDARYQEVGPAGSLFFIFFTGYSIARFRLLDISRVIRRGIAYGVSIAVLAGAYMAAVVVVDELANRFMGLHSVKPQAVLAMVIATLFQPFYRAVEKLVNVLFFRASYNYSHTLRTLSRSLTSVLDLNQLRDELSNAVMRSMQVESATLAICTGGAWEMSGVPGGIGPTRFPPFLTAMGNSQTAIREEIAQLDNNPEALRLAAAMARIGADVALPLLVNDELVGILLVGPKRAGTVFTDQDIALLSTLANQAAIAVRNAQLYQEVRSSQQYTAAILERLDSAVLTVGRDGAPIVTNQVARDLLPAEGDHLVLPPILKAAVARVFRTSEEQSDLEFDLIDAQGLPAPVVATVCPFLSDSGSVESALLVIRNISVLRRLEDERLRAERFSSVSRVAATLAHEIRNPLASIKTFFDLLPEKYLDVDFRVNFGSIASQEVERINALVGNLLAADKSAKGAWEEVRIDQVLSTTIKFVEQTLKDKNIRLNYICQDNIPGAMGDPSQLRQLFLNLLLNAQQAAPPASTITVRLFCGPNGEAISEVINFGKPISPIDLPRLFEPFFTTRSQGTGLGLTVCQQVADYHRGTISAESSEESGTIFRLSIPAVGVPV